MAKEAEKKVKVVMRRNILGERNEDGELPVMEEGGTYAVSEKFAQRLVWKERARYATKEDEAKAAKSGPIEYEDLAGGKRK